ncbi:MAG: hypothetical protein ACLVEU_02910 [Bacteroides cellulosilyticus]
MREKSYFFLEDFRVILVCMINPHKQKGDHQMKKIRISRCNISIVLHASSPAACGEAHKTGQEENQKVSHLLYSQSAMPGGNKDADAEKGKEELPGNLDDIEAEAILEWKA